MNYAQVKSVWGCLECWPRMCHCKCPHGVWMNMECAECCRVHEESDWPRKDKQEVA